MTQTTEIDKLTIKDVDITGKRVLVRVDFNVPLDENQNITDDTRITSALPTIQYALEQNAKVILMSHLGRPKGKVVDGLRLKPVAERLAELLSKPVTALSECIGESVVKTINDMNQGEVILLENLRFHKEETDNDENFSKELAKLTDIYVNDAFGTAHRAHASTEGITKFVAISAAGFLLEKEIKYLCGVLDNPQKPFAAILGGAKVADKIPVIKNLMKKADTIIIGGGMAYTFLKVQGKQIGSSKLESEMFDLSKEILEQAKVRGVKILLPCDHIITQQIKENAQTKISENDIKDTWMGVDIGPKTIEQIKKVIKDAKTVVWNGPLGIFEMDVFSNGTRAILEFLANSDVISVIGGGDTAAAASKFKVADKMSHISTGGGASLELMEGKLLPGLAALTNKKI